MNQLRILLVHNRYRWLGGEEATVERLYKALQDAGQRVRLLESDNPHSTGAALRNLSKAPWNPTAFKRISTVIEEFRPDVVHIHNTWFSLSPAVFKACHKHNVPTVTTIQNYRLVCPEAHLFRDGEVCTACVDRLPLPSIKYRCYRGSATLSALSAITTCVHDFMGSWASIDRVHVPSCFARKMLEAGPFLRSQFVVFPNAVEDPGKRPQAPSRSRTLLFVGRLSQEKGLDLVLEAWDKARISGLELVVAGDGPLRDEWERMAPVNVRFVGQLDRAAVSKLMESSRALLFPSKWFEVCPMVIVEALAAGLPVIGHDLGAVTELIDFGSPHSLVDPSDGSGWVRSLHSLGDSTLVDELGTKAREAYERRHTIAAWVDQHLKMYETAIE